MPRLSLAFGPIYSRRLGWSLGVRNVPGKNCSYDCVYCQAGRTVRLTADRAAFYSPGVVASDVEERLGEVERRGGRVDYISVVPEGEPTLDLRLGELLDLLRGLGRPVAVFTNSSLLWRRDVREDLSAADLVNVKVDAARAGTWRRVNRPHPLLGLGEVIGGLRAFASEYTGRLLAETMLVGGVDYGGELAEIAGIVASLNPEKAYVAVPVRPPAEPVEPPGEEDVLGLYRLLEERLGRGRVELLTGLPGVDMELLSDPGRDILEAAGVHPLRIGEAARLLEAAGANWGVVEELVRRGLLRRVVYRGEEFLVRRLTGKKVV